MEAKVKKYPSGKNVYQQRVYLLMEAQITTTVLETIWQGVYLFA